MAQHSTIVGGSTAKRVINCPGSVALVQQMPPQPSSVHADTGTLLHNTIASILETGKPPHEFLGATYNAIELTEDLLERKLLPALAALDEIRYSGWMITEQYRPPGLEDAAWLAQLSAKLDAVIAS